MKGTHWGKGTIGLQAAVPKGPTRDFFIFLYTYLRVQSWWFFYVAGYLAVVMGPLTTACRVLKLRLDERPPIWRVVPNILNKQSRTADKGWPSSLGGGVWRGADNSSPKKTGVVMKHKPEPRAWTGPLIRSKQ